MQNYEGFRKAGTFTLTTGTKVQGELCLNGAKSTLKLYSGEFFDTEASPDIFGLFYDRSKVSLINCITTSGPGSGAGGGEHYHFSSVFTVNDAATLFCDSNAFGLVRNARPHMERIAEERQWGREIEIGENPELFYFTGKDEIFVVNTVLGKISAMHGISFTSPGPEGIHVDNTIGVNIAFNSERTIREAVASLLHVIRFLEVIAGRPQNISKLAVLPSSVGEHPEVLDVYWCIPPLRDCDCESCEPIYPFGMLIQAASEPDEFTRILQSWLERNDGWRQARNRFSNVFACQNKYNIDRLVGAANMFDILPSSVYPEIVTLPPDLVQARDNAREAFRILPASPERNSVLTVLGRIGKPTLKRKVRSRAKLITDSIGDHFPELDMVVDQAIDCRNYYVHGSDARIDYNKNFVQVQFFTDTLEFVFAASDLVESGWDITAWAKRGSARYHPFGRYLINYALGLSELKKLLLNSDVRSRN